jgi:hypothetical protein
VSAHPARRLASAALLATVLGLVAAASYYHAFSYFAAYDDEGYLMLSVRHLLAGHRPYDDIQVFYGPLYYLEKWLLHGVAGAPLTHDVVRLTALVTRLSAVILAAVVVWRTTRSFVAAGLALPAVAQLLLGLGLEPGHPQELVVVLTAALPLAAHLMDPDRPARALFASGLLVAALSMLKANLGVLGGLAVGLSALGMMRGDGLVLMLRALSLGIAIALPWAIVHGGPPGWPTILAQVTSVWVAGLAMPAFRAREGPLRPIHLLALAAGAALGVTVLVLFALAKGASLAALVEMLVVRARGLAVHFTFSLPIPPWAVGAAWAGALAAIVLTVSWRRGEVPVVVSTALRLVLVAQVAMLERAGWTFFATAPLAWLVVLPRHAGARAPAEDCARLVLAWLTVLLPLQAFPVPGSQLICGGLPGVICAMVALGDAIADLPSLIAVAPVRRRVETAAGVAVLVAALAASGRMFVSARAVFAAGQPLRLAGAARLNLALGAGNLMRLAAAIRTRCLLLITLPGFHSLHFWTERWPPTLDLIPHETRLLADDRIAALSMSLRTAPRTCVLRGPSVSRRPLDPRIESGIMPYATRVWSEGPYVLYVGVR